MNVWLVVITTVVCAQSALLYILLKQVAQLVRSASPAGARLTDEGPRIGENIQHYLSSLASPPNDKALLLVLASTTCDVCQSVREGAERLYKHWKNEFDILFVYEDNPSQLELNDNGIVTLHSIQFRRSLGVSFVPFALVATPGRTVISKGLVNHIGHLESLLEQYHENQNPS